ncbi:SCO family protein [Teichococcus aestuarii]|uniref:SCO family protein n=1 Tax=Teichococcus aestuarii TaxID=568898 RepID=A0A2U1UYV7_9PROT|nr:SCO family protein [Pseudoroseomonas aestuarii]PWC26840.1 SCO family protein [Pseudoroseomonas aestuarii]
MNRRTLLATLGVGIPVAGALGWGVSEWMLRLMQSPASPSSPMQQSIGSPFALTDHAGRRVTDTSYAGTVRLVFFGFTHCPDVCPTGLGYIAEVLDGLGDEAAKVRPLFISVDSSRDTPELLASYVTQFHPALIGLTGSEAEVAQAAKVFRTYYGKVSTGGDSYVMEHSASIYLLGSEGTLRGFLDTHEPVATAVSKVRLALRDTAPNAATPAGASS